MRRSIYIAAPFSQRARARRAREVLERQGWESTSRWIDSHLEEGDLTPEIAEKEGTEDLIDVYRADAFVLLNDCGPSTTGAMHVEFGYALAVRKPIFLVGKPLNVFQHFQDRIVCVESVEDVR